MFLNKFGLTFGENDVRNQNIQLDRLPVVSDQDPSSATKSGFIEGYKDLTGGSILYSNTNPIDNPTFQAQYVDVNIQCTLYKNSPNIPNQPNRAVRSQ